MLRKSLFALYMLTVACMGLATFVEKWHGTDYADSHIYDAWWFSLLWGALAAVGVAYIVSRRVKRPSVVVLHASFVVILLGALLTHLTAVRGVVHLRDGQPTDKYLTLRGDDVEEHALPFTMELDRFETHYYDGTRTPSDYVTLFTISDDAGRHTCRVSMNRIHSHHGYRFYQSDFDPDMRGSILALNADPWGIGVTYLGYALLFVSLVWMLFDPRGSFRRLLGSPLLRRGGMAAALVMVAMQASAAPPTLPRDVAERFGRLYVLHAGRICPVQTLAIDITKKTCGAASYDGLTAEQVLTGWLFYGDEWAAEPCLRLKRGAMRERLQLPGRVSVSTFFNRAMGGYILGSYVAEWQRGNRDAFHRQVGDIDDRLMLLMQLRRGMLLRLFPCTVDGQTVWHAAGDRLPAAVPHAQALYINNVLAMMREQVEAGNTDSLCAIIDKLARYQVANAGSSLPSAAQTRAERAYNAVPFATVLFMVCLAAGLLSLLFEIVAMAVVGGAAVRLSRWRTPVRRVAMAVLVLSWVALSCCEALRWVASGSVPLSNGYETMLFVAWAVMALALVAARRLPFAVSFGLLMAGFFLLVSHISLMDPNISSVMPVLNSPLLTAHVSVIMLSFALLSLTFVCGLVGLVVEALSRRSAGAGEVLRRQSASLAAMGQLLLCPALATLAAGIFIGAVWANVSWGRYWSWDAKETWALIALMVYAAGAHRSTLPALQRPLCWHLFATLAFASIAMTYFGVNYFLGSGMHTYA